MGGNTHLLDNDWSVQGIGLSAGWKLVFFLLEAWVLHVLPAGGNKSHEGPLPAPSAPRLPWLSSAYVGPGSEWQRHLSEEGEMGASHSENPGAFPAPVGVGGGLKDKDSLWAPFGHPHTLTQWAQVWDGNSSNKLGHPLSLGRAPGEGAGERTERHCQLPTGLLCTHK